MNNACDAEGVTVLEAVQTGHRARPVASKIFSREADGKLHVSNYDSAYKYRFHLRRWDDLAAMELTLKGLAVRPHHLIVRGAPVEGLDPANTHRRLLHPAGNGDAATLRDVPRRWCALDFDQSEPLKDFDWSADPRRALDLLMERDLPLAFQRVDCVASFTAGQGFKSTMRWRAFFLLDRPLGSRELRAVLGGFNRGRGVVIDPALASAAQPHYTAAPIFRDGVHDPLPKGRVFTFVKDRRRAALPVAAARPPASPSTSRPFTGRFPAAVVRILDEMKTDNAFHQQWIKAFGIWFAAYGSDVDPVPLMHAVDDVLRDYAVPLRGPSYREQAWRQMSEFAVTLRTREQRAAALASTTTTELKTATELMLQLFAARERVSREETARQPAVNDQPRPAR